MGKNGARIITEELEKQLSEAWLPETLSVRIKKDVILFFLL